MLAVDPTQFPDENPLFIADASDPRCGEAATTMAECAMAQQPTLKDLQVAWMVADSADQCDEATPGDAAGLSSATWIALGAGALLFLGVIAVAVLIPLAESRSRKRAHAQQTGIAPEQTQPHSGQHPPQEDGNAEPHQSTGPDGALR